jgi:hypothetical protein
MTFWTWTYLLLMCLALVPVSWAVGKAVGMERASWGRALVFAVLSGVACWLGMWAMPFGFFALKAFAGSLAAMAVSPLVFRALMTGETSRAVLGSLLLCVGTVALTVLAIVL